MLICMPYRLGLKGEVVIPMSMRDQPGISPGNEVDPALNGETLRDHLVRVTTSLRDSLAGHGLVSELEADHRTESEH